MKRILIGYDGSEAADAAIHDLTHAALPTELEATVISVADVYLPTVAAVPEPVFPEVPPLLIQKAHEKALQEVEAHRGLATRACSRLHSIFPKWKCTPEAMADSPGWAIVRKAEEWKADLVVLGSQSHSRLERLFLGSVSHKVAAEAPCSVRIGRPRPVTDEPHIVVAVDGSIDSKVALHQVASRTWPADAHFRLVTVIDPRLETAIAWPGFLPDQFVQASDQSGREWIARMTETAAGILHEAGLNVSNYIYDGHPKEVLVRVSDEWQADSIFLGARGLNHGHRLSLGAVAASVATRAHCSVEIVRNGPGQA